MARDRRDVARLIELLGLPSGSRILDVPCGQGRHAHLLAEAGVDVDGLDYSTDVLDRARNLPMRCASRFGAVVNLFTSFGFFIEPADDRKVLAEFARVLKPDGVLV